MILYIVYIGDIQSTNHRRHKSAFRAKYLGKYCTDLDHIFRVGRSVGADDKSDIRFTIAQGTFLW